jgi:hypothetical protein
LTIWLRQHPLGCILGFEEVAVGKKDKHKGSKKGTYLTPGVYVEEVPSANKPIEGVGTSVAAFVGLSPFSPSRLARTLALAAAVAFIVRKVR